MRYRDVAVVPAIWSHVETIAIREDTMRKEPAQPDLEQRPVHRHEHRRWMGLEPSIVVVGLVVAMGFGFHEHHKLNEANARLGAYAGSETVQQQLQRARDLEQREEQAEAPAEPEIGAAGPIRQREPARSADDDDGISE